ncbi:YggT family protein [Streptomonospora nanhaiensis]|uniref:YggT family protein n=1 Tax=Streptomonospora nanhaiensis TaxID=1323731 RepID=A0A853BK03_9ACTN|nr:YggT family protein [Streptomonospora nanhaiensis]MBV2362503.1 YggT family protein [Streptomonospora nanhaiensis]MBX9389335.1 YggT family protein [Streptomonospora nanhaiensis]NYI94836.1 YggT family protein [Streptomonospora nanhaiensis]
MSIVQSVVIILLNLFMLVLIARLVFELVQSFARSWRPSGFVLVLAETTYTITDPPLRFLRRFIPPVRLGSVALDLSFTVLFLFVVILIQIVSSISFI